jgi:hydroxymethylglutaryl-CoA reductase
MKLPSGWRKLTLAERRAHLAERYESAAAFFSSFGGEGLESADAMIENAIGYYPVPLGLVQGLVVDGVEYAVPVATEEASVIAAASFAARVIASGGGFHTSATQPVMLVQIFVPDRPGGSLLVLLEKHRDELLGPRRFRSLP